MAICCTASLSPISNKRTDQYGGSLGKPAAVSALGRASGPGGGAEGVPLGARITGSDWREGGLTPDDAVLIAKALKAEGLDFICVSSGGALAEIRARRPSRATTCRSPRG